MDCSAVYVGIDISKDYFDVAIVSGKGYRNLRFNNDVKDITSFIRLLSNEHHCIMEASGPYYMKLASMLSAQGIRISVVNPLVIRRFCQMRLSKAKTDKKDAEMIAAYGVTEKPGLWQMPGSHVIELKQMQATVFQYIKQRTACQRQIHAFKHNHTASLLALDSLEQSISFIQQQIDKLEKEMEQMLNQHQKELLNKITSIPGVGKKTAMLLLISLGDIRRFEKAKQLISYVGLSPRIFQSGSSVRGKVRICKMGMAKLRASLYVCAWSASKANKACYDLYERLLAKGKSKKLALVAVANKLLKQIFAITTKNTVYQKNFDRKICF
jgi:transposase